MRVLYWVREEMICFLSRSVEFCMCFVRVEEGFIEKLIYVLLDIIVIFCGGRNISRGLVLFMFYVVYRLFITNVGAFIFRCIIDRLLF